MKTLNIAYYTILRNLRDYKAMSFTLLLPIMLIVILGSALSQAFTFSDISATTICYINEDEQYISQAFEKFLSSEEISKLVQCKTVATKEEAFELIKNKDAVALVVLPVNLSKDIQTGKEAAIEVYSSKYTNLRQSIVQSVLNSFINGTNTQLVMRQLGETALGYKIFDNIKETVVTSTGNAPSAMDYYSVTMLVLTIMYGTSYGNYALKEEKLLNTHIRLTSAPITQLEVVLGKLLGTIATVFMQAMILIVFTKTVYDVNWGGNLPFIIFVCLSASVMSVGLGMMVSNIGKNPNTTGGLLNLLVNITTFLAGGYFPASQIGPTLEKLGAFSPNYLAQQAMFNTIYGGSAVQTTNVVLAIWIISAASFVIAALTQRRIAN